ncbi:SMAD/FHA domain-containing protein, partial [Coemansia reversa NRRL 1564]
LSYEQPLNAGTPQHNYNMEVIKDGSVVESHTVARDKTYFTFGRLPICDFPMEHGSISRYHAVLQFHDDGSMTIVDLGSSHGTFINRKQITARTPSKVDIGDQIRFGASSRIWII